VTSGDWIAFWGLLGLGAIGFLVAWFGQPERAGGSPAEDETPGSAIERAPKAEKATV